MLDVIILAAGRGTRMGERTAHTPKPLLLIAGKPIVIHTLESLKDTASRFIFVVGHLAHVIQDRLGSEFLGIPITYVSQQENMGGTAGAVWATRDAISSNPFMVLSGDDRYDPDELKMFARERLAIAIGATDSPQFLDVDMDEHGYFKGLKTAAGEHTMTATGAYILNKDFFTYDPAMLKSGEYGLPQTVARMAQDHPVKCFEMKKWRSINTPEDLSKAESMI